ncbi:hypothetical protein [Desulfurivibrio dismutans]|uniref:hypothetical protein n=1 Tax=Desulfurivibrio dismutans TaxID=1398908 RepID=UPI0023DC8C58|nr:hypothetical protein [Desulfurivibrio alkaliphilus]MDF1613842.1 hypothetical protein [Desulfurivibrio alkaliphilus]
MKIKDQTYENLTPDQRVVALMEASIRDDEAEMRRLVATTPRRTYVQGDAAVVDKLEWLTALCIAIELDMANMALTAFLVQKHDGIKASFNEAAIMAAMNEASARWFESRNVPRETWLKFRPKRHFMVDNLIDLAPEPADFDVQNILDQWARQDIF